jgi:hypothetical protein
LSWERAYSTASVVFLGTDFFEVSNVDLVLVLGTVSRTTAAAGFVRGIVEAAGVGVLRGGKIIDCEFLLGEFFDGEGAALVDCPSLLVTAGGGYVPVEEICGAV